MRRTWIIVAVGLIGLAVMLVERAATVLVCWNMCVVAKAREDFYGIEQCFTIKACAHAAGK